MRKLLIALNTLAFGMALTVGPAWAQDQTQPPPPPDQSQTAALNAQTQGDAAAGPEQATPPVSNAGVARVSVVSGSVSTQRADTGDWEAGTINAPLVTGDKISTGADGRAEVQLDYANILRLSSAAQANLASLTNSQIQVQLAAGTADYVVLKGAQSTAEIDTPNVAVRPRGNGVFRIEVVSDSESRVIVRDGEADISTPQGSTTLKKGQLITVQGTDTPQYQITDAPGEDAWDQWNKQRDNNVRDAKAVANTNQYYTGVQDLDGYGYWTYVPGYGNVWVPNDQSDNWAPYSDGRWSYEPYYGYTWVGYEPWGWAPYHYGRWFNYGSRWAWWPGPVSPFYRPIWAPAYVSFFGFGGGGFGFGFGFGGGYGGFGSIGWLALGPGDGFRPWWGGRGYGMVRALAPERAGRPFYSNLREAGTNARVRGGMTVEASDRFGHGDLSAHGRVTESEFRGAQAIHGAVPVTPNRASMSVSGRAVSGRAVPQNAATHFFNSGAESRNGMAAGAGARSFGQAGAGAEAGRTNGAPQARGQASAGAGWQRFGEAGRSSGGAENHAAAGGREANPSAGRASTSAAGNGWQRFTPQARGNESAQQQRGAANERQGSQGRPPLQIGHPVMQAPRSGYSNQREEQQRYSAPQQERQQQQQPRYSAPQQAPRMSAPRMSAPRMSAPASRGGGGGGSRGGGGGHHR